MSPERIGENLGDLLLRDGLVSNDALEEALQRQQTTGKPLTSILVEMNAITEQVKVNFLQRRLGHDVLSLREINIPEILFTYYPRSMAERLRAVPCKLEGDTIVIAMEDPSDLQAVDSLKARIGMKVRPVIATSADVDTVFAKWPVTEAEAEEDVLEPAEPGLVGKLIKTLFFPVLAFAPLVVMICMLLFSHRFQYHLTHAPWELSPGETIFSLMLIWGIWSLLVYELDGLFVNPEHRT